MNAEEEVTDLARLKYPHMKFSCSHKFVFSIS